MLKKKRVNIKTEEIDITSLLDVLVILLVFLLQNLTNADLTLDLVNELALPYSQSRDDTAQGPTIQINSKKQLFLNSRSIGEFNEESEKFTGKFIKELGEIKPKEIPNNGLKMNLVFDKTLEYSFIDKVLKLISSEGFTQFKFIILKNE